MNQHPILYTATSPSGGHIFCTETTLGGDLYTKEEDPLNAERAAVLWSAEKGYTAYSYGNSPVAYGWNAGLTEGEAIRWVLEGKLSKK